MKVRHTLVVLLPLLLSVGAPADTVTQDVSFDKPVQIPEAVLQPGKYTIHLEDHLPDRAIVRISEAGGTDHYLLTVPSKKLSDAGKGLIFFPGASNTEILHAWECAGCKTPLEFVYPKDEAVKLTGETYKPILAYDASYDKLPANLSPEDRKVVTLWLLAPKTVTPEGKGEGLTAAKYSSPKLTASAQPLPGKLPKTAGNAFLEIAIGLFLLALAGLLFSRRKLAFARH
jgi:LPXTG-motif cell wall-anchored protein